MKIYYFIWKFKYHIALIILCVFLYSIFKLSNAQIYFDSERIINELKTEIDNPQLIDDNNLIFLGFELYDSLNTIEDYKIIDSFHNKLKRSPNTKRVFSIINDREIIESGLIPIYKKTLNLKSENSLSKSLNKIKSKKNNFITKDLKNIFFLIESEKSIEKEELKNFINSLYNLKIHPKQKDVYIAGRSPSEIYFQKKVINEFLIITAISATLCFIFLFLISQNLKLVLLTVLSVIICIVVTLGLSQLIFGGIELIMIITPAILFIVCISDIMHFTNKQKKVIKDKYDFFIKRIDKVGKAIILTSFTTAISFLTFIFNDIPPISRFGIITSFGVLFTLLTAITIYAISIEKEFHYAKPIKILNNLISNLGEYFSKEKRTKIFHFSVFGLILFGLYATFNTKIDNYLTDEINKKSLIYKHTNYFDKNFGGIKPIIIEIKSNPKNIEISEIKEFLKKLNFTVDFNSQKSILNLNKSDNPQLVCRVKDEGSLKTLSNLQKLEAKFNTIEFSYSGAGHLFDMLGNNLTKKLIYGLLIAILTIGIIFFLINNFKLSYFLIATIPNVIPIIVCLGILYNFNFYFSLSNAFIFTIVFGLIIDDSIHVISAYSKQRQLGLSQDESIKEVLSRTGIAVIKTTFIVLICLLPLAFSEFKSVSQLSFITIICAVIAVFFDLIYLPKIIKKLTK